MSGSGTPSTSASPPRAPNSPLFSSRVSPMKILVVGSGGREHALAWKLAAEPGVSRRHLRTRQRRHRPDRPHRAGRRRRHPGPARPRAPRGHRPDGRRPGAAARPRHRRSLFVARAANLWPAARGRPARVQQGVREGVHGPVTGFRPRAIGSATARRGAGVLASGELGFPIVVKADGLAAGKGVVVAADRGGGRGRDRERDGGSAVRRGRRSRSCWRNVWRVPKCRSSRCATAAARSASVGPGSQAHLRRRSRARTPAAWARSRRARCRSSRCRSHHDARSSSRSSRACGARAMSIAASSTPD